jgi:hypothetical protein
VATKGITFAGRTILIPGAYGFGDASEMVEIRIGALNVVMLVGTSEGGEPNKPLYFSAGSKERALKVLRGGPLHAAARAAWTPSPESKGADVIIALRVNQATRAKLTFLDTAGTPAEAFDVFDRDWGKHGVGTQVGILAGKDDPDLRRVVIKKISDKVDQISTDLGNVLAIAYTGNGSACTIDVGLVATVPTLTVSVTGATDGSTSFQVDLTDPAVDTIEKLADLLQSQTGFNVKVLGAAQMKSEWLDPIGTPVALTATAAKLTAINGACVEFINRFAVCAVAEFKSNVAPVAVTAPTFLSGGAEGTATLDDYKAAFAKLAAEPGYFLVPCTDDDLVQGAALEHCLAMSDIKIKMRRTAYFGHALGEVVFNPDGSTDITALAERIFKLNSERVLMATPGIKVEDKGAEKLFPSWLLAAAMAGIKAGGKPQDSLTGKYVLIKGLEGDYDPTQKEEVISAAASYVAKTKKGFRIGIGQLAQIRTTNTLASEPSVLHVSDTILTNMEELLEEKYVGIPPTSEMNIRLGQIKRDVEKMLDLAAKEGMLVGGLKDGKAVKPFRNVKVTFSNRTYSVEFEASIAEPGNYITITAHWAAVQGVAA